MTEEQYNDFRTKTLNSFQSKAEHLSCRPVKYEYKFYYAYIKLSNGKKVLFYNQNGKYLFRSKRTLISQINEGLFYDGRFTWNDSHKDKKRFVEENVEIVETDLPFYENY